MGVYLIRVQAAVAALSEARGERVNEPVAPAGVVRPGVFQPRLNRSKSWKSRGKS